MDDETILHDYVELAEKLNSENQVVAFPSIGEYLIFDELAYLMLVEDKERMAAFRAVIQKSVRGKTVFDIGTGDRAPLAVICIEAGAKHVYAVEIDEIAAARAREYVKTIGLAEKITVIHGDSINIKFPDKVDVCVAEVIGNIGSAEGAPVILKNALRFLNPGSKFIPEACITKIAPAMLPEHVYTDEKLDYITEFYTKKIYEKTGNEFPLTRQVYYNFPPNHIISKPATFENDCYKSVIFPDFDKTLSFKIRKDAIFDGFLLWINLFVDTEHMINSLISQNVWAPVFLKTEPIAVAEGDIINAVCKRRFSKNQVNPDYYIEGTVQSEKHDVLKEFSIASYFNPAKDSRKNNLVNSL